MKPVDAKKARDLVLVVVDYVRKTFVLLSTEMIAAQAAIDECDSLTRKRMKEDSSCKTV